MSHITGHRETVPLQNAQTRSATVVLVLQRRIITSLSISLLVFVNGV